MLSVCEGWCQLFYFNSSDFARIHLVFLGCIPDSKKSEKKRETLLTPSLLRYNLKSHKSRELLKLWLKPDTLQPAASGANNFANSVECTSNFGIAMTPRNFSIVLAFRNILQRSSRYSSQGFIYLQLSCVRAHTHTFIPTFAVLLWFLSLYLIFLEDEYLQSSVYRKCKDNMVRDSVSDSELYSPT